MTDPTSYAIIGIGVVGLAWLWFATWQGIDPVGWFR
jgi:glycine/D-amino acid oxidase-like deaminating enzyme